MSGQGWIGVDLDGTLAFYDGWRGVEHIGPPIPAMVERVQRWRAQGITVKIFTARVGMVDDRERSIVIKHINRWCEEHLGEVLEVTCQKDYHMYEYWDDRAVAVETNTGRVIARGEP